MINGGAGLKRLGLDGFIWLLFASILAAWLAPGVGSGEVLAGIAHWGVAVIFFFYGLRLNWQQIHQGLANYKLHIVVQLATFVLFPALVFPFAWGMQGSETYHWIGIGMFFLAALPSTVSSSVVMVNIARGNVPAAIFDASISSLLGVFLTPLWMQVFIHSAQGGKALPHVIFSLILQVIVPILAGILLHAKWGWISVRYDKRLRQMDQGIILLIVYTSFCHSFQEEMFAPLAWTTLLNLTGVLFGLFWVVFYLLKWICLLLRFSREDTITTIFCGSKKSLVHATVMAQVLLTDSSLAGILLLPIMIYHAMQLILVSIVAQKAGNVGD
ncbi:MAG: bile acid:sodium symporter family protein [Planctomycetia bacterium]|nr:bile acid:sodium symporter family protein [Planctomycetia bacterium]